MHPIVFLAFFVVGCALGSPLANQYFDNVVYMAFPNEARMQKLDPFTIFNFTTEFEDKVKIIGKVKGKAEFFNGQITGLSKIRRHSEGQGPYYAYGSKSYNCTIAFDDISIQYEGKLKYGKMPKVDIKGKANVTITLIFAEVNQGISNLHPTLKKFQFQQVGNMQMKFTGLGPLNKYANILEDGFKANVNPKFFDSISQVQLAFTRAINQIPMP